MLYFLIILLACTSTISESKSNHTKFPKGFRFGIATASYQIEGAWNESDKSENVWDHFTHFQPEKITDHSTGDVACDSYHNYKRDVEMLVELGVDFYRFSIAWSRILPNGHDYYVSQDGLNYYNNLINELVKHNIKPMVTLFHWDTPQKFQDIGGWANPLIVDYFEDYARVVFKNFGDRVTEWITFNEPYNMCLFGYGSRTGFVRFAPDIHFHGTGEYLCTHHVVKAHARAYHLYKRDFKKAQGGKMSMASILLWPEPESSSKEDVRIAEKGLQFNMGWICHPIFTKEGDYPRVMREEVDRMSKMQGFRRSRLPSFTPEEVASIRGTFDFVGINYYTAIIYRNNGSRPEREIPSHENDLGHLFYQGDDWETGASSWLKLRPQGLTESLKWVAKEYGNAEIYITENGYSSRGGLNDLDRVSYFNNHLAAVLDAIYDHGVNVTAYTAWSLMDNFEWTNGYTERFGMYQVDFSSPNKTRTPRMSALVYKEIIKSKTLNYSYCPVIDEPEPIETKLNFPFYIILSICLLIFLAGLTVAICNATSTKNSIRRQML